MRTPSHRILFPLASLLLIAGCGSPSSPTGQSITDAAFLRAPLWDDGQAEVAFYDVRRSRNQYGEAEEQEFLVGTYLVKHDFDPTAESKARPEAAERIETFKYALFYELVSGSYQYKRSYVTNARRSDLRPMKSSFASFDWCANQYRELSIHPNGEVDYLMRSDDYGNAQGGFEYVERTYPPAQLPLLVRGLQFSGADTARFGVLLEDGAVVPAIARLAGRDSLETPAGRFAADRIELRFEAPVPSPIAEETDSLETYWVAGDEARTLLRVEGASGRYEMHLVEALRSPYWDEDVYDRLQRVRERP